jgi:dinuclear metal center YbgI/SA1388 family protein
MLINEILSTLENFAPISLQEDYDNAGLLTGNVKINCTGVLISLDCTEEIVQEAIDKHCNLIVAHHPIIFKGLKKINGKNYIERTIIKAIKNDIAIYAMHTNLDNVHNGVSFKMAQKLGLQNLQVLAPKNNLLQKLILFSPEENAEQIKQALFATGAGNIGNYSACSFTSVGIGCFTPGLNANPQKGEIGKADVSKELKIEVVFPIWLQNQIVAAMKKNHPYEEVAYDILTLNNTYQNVGSGVVGGLPKPMLENDFLSLLSEQFKTKVVKHTALLNKPIKKVALCGGSGSFLIPMAKASKADAFITSDLKYHEYFDADNQFLLADIGHFESEQYTIDLIHELLHEKFPNFALQKTGVNTNPVQYFVR